MRGLSIIALVISITFFTGCSQPDVTEFEKASGIRIPPGADEQETHDDGKFVKTSAFLIENETLKALVRQHQFEKFTPANIPQFWGINNMREKPSLENLESFYYKNGYSGNLSWIYIADLKSSRLWTEIKYQGKPAY